MLHSLPDDDGNESSAVPSDLAPDGETVQTGTLRIGLFSESFHPVQNGVTTSVITLVEELRSLNHKVWIFAPEHQDQNAHETNVLRFPSFVSSLNRGYPVAYPFFPRLALASHFSRLRLDLVHTHTPFVLGLTGANLALSRELPLVSTFHTLYTHYSHYLTLVPDTVTQGFLETYLPWYYNRCDHVICPSHVAANELRRMGVETPISIIATGVPLPPSEALTKATRKKVRAQLGVHESTPVLLYAGRLAEEKNLSWLLKTFVEIRKHVPDARLVLVGGGPLQEQLETQAEFIGLGHSTIFLGPTPRSQLDALYASADVFCFPSPSETQGLVICEARAAGLPCITLDAGGAPETVTDGEDGYRIPVAESQLFVSRTVEVLCNRVLRDTMRANAMRNAHNFTPGRMAENVMEVYRGVCSLDLPTGRFRPRQLPDALDFEDVGQVMRDSPSSFFKTIKNR